MTPAVVRKPVQAAAATSLPCPSPSPSLSPLEMINAIWASRRCSICGRFGYCAHREPLVEMAELEAWARRVLARPVARPVPIRKGGRS